MIAKEDPKLAPTEIEDPAPSALATPEFAMLLKNNPLPAATAPRREALTLPVKVLRPFRVRLLPVPVKSAPKVALPLITPESVRLPNGAVRPNHCVDPALRIVKLLVRDTFVPEATWNLPLPPIQVTFPVPKEELLPRVMVPAFNVVPPE